MEEEKFFNDKQSKVKYIVIGVLLFFVLAIIGMVYYSLTPKVILSETIKSLEYLTLGMLMGLENGTMRLVSIVDIRILYDNKSVLVKDYLEILEEEAIKKK